MTTHSRTRRWFLYVLIGAFALAAFGGAYQAVAESFDRERSHAPGRLVDIGGRRLHLLCVGSGSPTVVLESGLGEAAGYWAWVLASVGRDTRVCAYDRAGRGWSDGPKGAQDGVAVAADLHSLLERGQIGGPVVLVGHSSGAQYVRIFAGRYPRQVAGMVLLDGQPAEAFERLPDFPAFYQVFRPVSAVLPSLARLGVGRLVFSADFDDLPPQAREMQRFNYSSTRFYRSLRDELPRSPSRSPRQNPFRPSAMSLLSW
ncbi:MAG: alpha/beta hydrolase [Acidobacteria bacterium]|nr:alpha/beta hydrolase [Acidobacteriota bacterium]